MSVAPAIALLRFHLRSQATLLGMLILALIIVIVAVVLPGVLDSSARIHTSRQADVEATR